MVAEWSNGSAGAYKRIPFGSAVSNPRAITLKLQISIQIHFDVMRIFDTFNTFVTTENNTL